MSQLIKSSTLVLVTISLLAISILAQTMDSGAFGTGSGYSDAEAYWNTTRFEVPLMTSIEKKLLLLSPDLKATYKDFLQQKDSGLIRLLPRELSNPKKSLAGGAYYSFGQQYYGGSRGADIRLEKNFFFTGGGGANLGFMVNLGDVSLDSISSDTSAISYVAQYSAPKKATAARSDFLKFQQGENIGTVLYKSSLPVIANNTYVLRSVQYRKSNTLVAFRVIKQDDNGSAILLWKILKEYSVPSL